MNQALALNLFEYVNGELFWKNPSNPKRIAKGDKAGTVSKRGYVHVQVYGKIYKAHQLVFLMMHGYIPKLIDHINGVLTDNRIENLREASVSENQQNAKTRADNSSGVKNVSWHQRLCKWTVQLSFKGKVKHFGNFADLELAALVAEEARNKYYGQFARHG